MNATPPEPHDHHAVLDHADGRIGLLYERGETSAYERLSFATFPLDWLESGRDAGARRLGGGLDHTAVYPPSTR